MIEIHERVLVYVVLFLFHQHGTEIEGEELDNEGLKVILFI